MYIYCLVDPRDGKPKYVGKTNNPKHRLKCHINEKRGKNRKINWVKKLKKINLIPLMIILEEISDDKWENCERFWISELNNLGYNLCNHTEGGEKGFSRTEDTCKKISENCKKRWKENREKYLEIARNPERRRKISENVRKTKSQMIIIQSKESNLERSKTLYNKPLTEEHKKKISEGVRKSIENGQKIKSKRTRYINWPPMEKIEEMLKEKTIREVAESLGELRQSLLSHISWERKKKNRIIVEKEFVCKICGSKENKAYKRRFCITCKKEYDRKLDKLRIRKK